MMKDYDIQDIKWFFSNSVSGRKAEEIQERWLNKFIEIITKLKDKSVKIDIYGKVLTPEWIKKVYSYLEEGSRERRINISDNPTFKVINTERFYALQYFLHEVFVLRLKGNDEENDEVHANALIEEYKFLESIAKALGYKASSGTLFDVHPLFQDEVRKGTKDNDKKLLSKIDREFRCIPAEIKNAQKFFKELEKL